MEIKSMLSYWFWSVTMLTTSLLYPVALYVFDRFAGPVTPESIAWVRESMCETPVEYPLSERANCWSTTAYALASGVLVASTFARKTASWYLMGFVVFLQYLAWGSVLFHSFYRDWRHDFLSMQLVASWALSQSLAPWFFVVFSCLQIMGICILLFGLQFVSSYFVIGMLATTVLLEYRYNVQHALMLTLFGANTLVAILFDVKKWFCDGNSFFQFHALWHVLGAFFLTVLGFIQSSR